jgi:1-acyl-sn-glycerol-3-phosphate acyltransferase
LRVWVFTAITPYVNRQKAVGAGDESFVTGPQESNAAPIDGASTASFTRIDPKPNGRPSTPLDPRVLETLLRHNRRIGSRAQRLIGQCFFVYFLGPIAFLLVRSLTRARTHGLAHFDAVKRGHVILAVQHFYEWDPIISFYASIWMRSLVRPHLAGHSIAGSFWTRTRFRRTVSWVFGILGLARGAGPGQSAFVRAGEIFARERPPTLLCVYPTGPIGRRRSCEIGPAAGYLANAAPHVPILPAAVIGLQEATWLDVLTLRRPRLTVVFGAPFRGSDLAAMAEDARVATITDRVQKAWDEAEAAFAPRVRKHD